MLLNTSMISPIKEKQSMKTRLYALVMAAILLFVPLLGIEASSLFRVPGDTVIQFPDPSFETMVRKIIGKPAGDITAIEVAGITTLDVSGLDITDLTGIEYFTALEKLRCEWNELTELDVSQNIMLTVLICNGNLLTTLDLRHNPLLTELECLDNQLTTLDVSYNPALTKLACMVNQLTTLDVSHNPALTIINCDDNQLTTLDVSHNPALIGLYCRNNSLTTLDISFNPALEHLDVYGNLFPDKSAIIGLDENKLKYFVFDPQNL